MSESFDRRMLVLGMFKGKESLTTQAIYRRLGGSGDEIDERSVQRMLEQFAFDNYRTFA
jgi:Fe2+ or Zn2+ uptake regulation protein